MTDIQAKTPTMASFAPMAMTGMGSSALGDKLGDALSQLVAWRIAVNCNCTPPSDVISAVHTICVGMVVLTAYTIYYAITRYNNRGVQS